MIYYLYDGSFDGLLTAIYEAYYRKEIPDKIITLDEFQEGFLIKKVLVETDKDKAFKVYHAVEVKISREALKNIFYAYLSEIENVGRYIFDYLRLGFKLGRKVDYNLSDERVQKILEIRKKVGREKHLLTGLIRFRLLEGNIYYAPINPKYNIVGLLAPHFVKRFPDQNWFIHDVQRNIGVFYNKKEWIIRDVDLKGKIKYQQEEEFFQNLWKEYFKNITIKNRLNFKLQKKNMPMRYWRFLVEME